MKKFQIISVLAVMSLLLVSCGNGNGTGMYDGAGDMAGRAVEGINRAGRNVAGGAEDAAQSAGNDVRNGINNISETARNAGESVKESAERMGEGVREGYNNAKDEVMKNLDGNNSDGNNGGENNDDGNLNSRNYSDGNRDNGNVNDDYYIEGYNIDQYHRDGADGNDGVGNRNWGFDDMNVMAEDGNGSLETLYTSSTKIYDTSEDRIHNINLAIEKIAEIRLTPGEEYSFNDFVGERAEHTGFREARALEGKEKTYEHGGGVCQISTTLFQAARGAGLDITERHGHQKKIDYAELGDDATVDYGVFDLKFKNTTDRDIIVKVSCDGEYVHSSIEKVK